MVKFRIRVDIGSGEYEVETGIESVIAWERKYKTKASKLAEGIGMEDICFLAWQASKKNKITVPAVFDDFINKIEDLEIVSTEDVNPTQEEPSDDSSESSS
jgi:hypothetical protein